MFRTFAILIIVSVLSFFVSLGSTPLWDPDEPRFAAATRDMVDTGDVMTPTFNGAPRFEKPILFYWLQLPFFVALGPTETAARLPSALAGFGCVALLYLIGKSYFSDRAAFIASLALATVFRFVAYTRQGLTDVPAMFFEMAAIYFFRAASLAPRSHAMGNGRLDGGRAVRAHERSRGRHTDRHLGGMSRGHARLDGARSLARDPRRAPCRCNLSSVVHGDDRHPWPGVPRRRDRL